jgi:putative ABC transport system ATP-binding protein
MTQPVQPVQSIRVQSLTKTYGEGETAVHAVDHITFEVEAGELVVILGASGSGKTTLLNMVGAIEEPTSGGLEVDGVELVGLSEQGKTAFRRDRVGFVFQLYNLVPTLTALENVQLVAELSGDDAESRSRRALEQVEIADRADHFPATMSGGQQQRVAIARAIVKDPAVLLCDEPTGALDLESGRLVLGVLQQLTHQGRTLLLVTHNAAIAKLATRVIRLSDGRVIADDQRSHPTLARELVW